MENPAILSMILKPSSQTWEFVTHSMGRNQLCKSLNQVPKTQVKPKLVISNNDFTLSANPTDNVPHGIKVDLPTGL